MKKIASFAACAMILTGFHATPALSQDAAGDRVNQLIIYGDDPCPQSTEGEIVVCARKDEGERYRIPETLRDNPRDRQNEAWSQRVKSYEYVGASGTNSCSPTGLGGATGCTQQLLRAAYAEKGQDDTVNWGQLIEAERQKRLARIDGEAEAVEERLREIEAQREAREAAAAAARERLEAKDSAELGARNPDNDLAVPPGAEETPPAEPVIDEN
ncbi:MAG: hypothetical protein AAGM33_00330 [Pseudomonadota bacterium]